MTSEKIYVSVKEAVSITGLSEFFIRRELRSGEIPHLRSGTKYLINLPAFLDRLNRRSGLSG